MAKNINKWINEKTDTKSLKNQLYIIQLKYRLSTNKHQYKQMPNLDLTSVSNSCLVQVNNLIPCVSSSFKESDKCKIFPRLWYVCYTLPNLQTLKIFFTIKHTCIIHQKKTKEQTAENEANSNPFWNKTEVKLLKYKQNVICIIHSVRLSQVTPHIITEKALWKNMTVQINKDNQKLILQSFIVVLPWKQLSEFFSVQDCFKYQSHYHD